MYARISLILALLLSGGCASLKETAAIDKLKPCKHTEGPTDAYCGTLDVWENRTTKTGRKIALKILILPALKRTAAPDPLFFLAGGPGQGAAAIAKSARDPLRRIGADRDLVFVDQRGTGKSNPLECKPDAPDDEPDDTSQVIPRTRACLDKLKAKADLTLYTTPIAMDDLDDVRAFLGYETINLYGGSYGTRAALVYARRHPANTRSVILDGVAPTGMALPLYMARDGQRALDLLLRDCASDAACNKRFPNLKQRFESLLARPNRKIKYIHPRTGLEKEAEIRRLTIGGILFSALYSPRTASLVPLLIEQAENNNLTGFFSLGAAFESTSESIAQGMHFSVVCAEDAPRIPPGAIDRETAGTFLGPEMADWRMKICDFWPKGQVDTAYGDNTPSPIPALILSGELDPVTPPVWGAQIAEKWPNSRHIVVPNIGHGALAGACVPKIMAQFLTTANAKDLDTGCVKNIHRPPFFLGPSGPDPMTGAPAQ